MNATPNPVSSVWWSLSLCCHVLIETVPLHIKCCACDNAISLPLQEAQKLYQEVQLEMVHAETSLQTVVTFAMAKMSRMTVLSQAALVTSYGEPKLRSSLHVDSTDCDWR